MDNEVDQAVNNIVSDDVTLNTPIVRVIDTKGAETLDDALADMMPTLPDF